MIYKIIPNRWQGCHSSNLGFLFFLCLASVPVFLAGQNKYLSLLDICHFTFSILDKHHSTSEIDFRQISYQARTRRIHSSWSLFPHIIYISLAAKNRSEISSRPKFRRRVSVLKAEGQLQGVPGI